MANDIIQHLISVNVALSCVVVLLAITRPIYRRHFGSRATYRLWLILPIALLALLIPPRQEVVSTPLFETKNESASEDRFLQSATKTMREPGNLNAAEPVVETATVSNAPTIDIKSMLFAVWFLGAGLGASVLIARQRRYVKSLGKLQVREISGIEAFETETSGVSPAIIGLFRQKLILPVDFESRFDQQQQQMILAHENAHMASRDVIVNLIASSTTIVFWFNPFLHWAAWLIREDQEFACDEVVASQFKTARKLYAETLLQNQYHGSFVPVSCPWSSATKTQLTKRIEVISNLASNSQQKYMQIAIALLLVIFAGGMSWAQKPKEVVLMSSLTPESMPGGTSGLQDEVLRPSATRHRTFSAQGLTTQNIAVNLRVIPEIRDDIELEVSNAHTLPMPTFFVENGRLIVDGGLNLGDNYCRDQDAASSFVNIPSHSKINRNAFLEITIRVPTKVDLKVQGHVVSSVGVSTGGTIENDSCGEMSIGKASGPLTVVLSNYGDVSVAPSEDHVEAVLYGFGDLTVAGGESADLYLTGIGDIEAGDFSKALAVTLIGEGNIQIAEARQGMRIELPGEGNISVGNLIGEFDVDLSGAGNIRVENINSAYADVEVSGVGDVIVKHGRINRVIHDLSGRGEFRLEGTDMSEKIPT